ncbi:MAG: hypothetical protein R3B47_06780 [Bacteroidia bacterium]
MNGTSVHVEAKNEVRPNHLTRLKEPLMELHKPVLVGGKLYHTQCKKLLKEEGINYVDRVGNAFFRLGPVYIYIDGIRNQPTEDRKNRAFTRTGLKVVFHFLNQPDLVNALPTRLRKQQEWYWGRSSR